MQKAAAVASVTAARGRALLMLSHRHRHRHHYSHSNSYYQQRQQRLRRVASSFECSTTTRKKSGESSSSSFSFSTTTRVAAQQELPGRRRARCASSSTSSSPPPPQFEDDDADDEYYEDDEDEEEDEEGYTELQLAKQAKAATIKSVKFISSVVRHQDCPQTKLPEVAFIGRSNVGKSSLVNMLTNRKNVAKVSKNPGKTQTINHYEITTGDGKWFLVDLPGYGFANAPEHLKKEWAKFTREYLLERKNLISVMLLVDSTVKPQKLDLEALEFLADNDIPATVVFTKADKKRKAKGGKRATPAEHVEMFADEISEMFEELPPFVFTSANSGEGKKELLNHIATIREFMKKGGRDEEEEEELLEDEKI
jgi:GTP-binding protein